MRSKSRERRKVSNKNIRLSPPPRGGLFYGNICRPFPLETTMYHLMRTTFVFICILIAQYAGAQQVTSVWKGKINRIKVEVKIVQRGDLLTGTSYYYESPNIYRRYSIQGYFDPSDNSVVWWDDKLIEEKGNFSFSKNQQGLKSVADFNCPGPGKMFLTGKSIVMDDPNDEKGPVELTNVSRPVFEDEWDFVIENYTVGGNDPQIIDSVALIAFQTNPPPVQEREEEIVVAKPPKRGMVSIPFPGEPRPKEESKPEPKEVVKPEPKEVVKPEPKEEIKQQTPAPVVEPAPSIEEKFVTRKKIVTTDITVGGEFIELRFYDNAQVDGDSISLFLNGNLLFQHIRLTEQAYTIRIPVADLQETNELTMVAENLGTIPPNTSYMVAETGGKRFEAKLASTENSSAVILLRKPSPTLPKGREQ